ncbi:MAG: Lrp/AsnC ligand binding domain-containing protein [Candidatus Nitrosocosmicus sp.]|nr:Lrp/AsnC ligand binding domain-containing protein [Candidatus Nitrosocosmicus sp.]
MGSTKEIVKEIKKVSGVDEVKEVIGLYDIIMKISADSVDELKETITKQIKMSDKIFSTRTLIMTNTKENVIPGRYTNRIN